MQNTLIQIALFLVTTLFNLYILAIMLRFLLQWVKADFYNPICQMLIKVTKPLLKPLRRIIPGFFGLDFAAIVLIYVLELILMTIIASLVSFPITSYILLVALGKALVLLLNLYFFAILIRAIASWSNTNPYQPLFVLLDQLTDPVLKQARRLLPQLGGFDFSPLLTLIVIQVLVIFIRNLLGA